MRRLLDPKEHWGNFLVLAQWSALAVPVGIMAGLASALFLWALDRVTDLRFQNPWLLFLLPAAGCLIVWVYQKVGKGSEAGNNLIVEQIHEPGGGVPRRMAPLILASTVLTHLFGGSAGREGTAVQMGGSLASGFGRLIKAGRENTRVLLMSGIAAGFGSVFGTPIAGAVFAMEVLSVGRMHYEALVPVLVASVVGDYVCLACGIQHASYHIATPMLGHFDLGLIGWLLLAGLCFGLVGRLFSAMTHGLQTSLKALVPSGPWRAVCGGLFILLMVQATGTRDYLGLSTKAAAEGSITLGTLFHAGGAQSWSWLWKLLFTSVTLAAGFKGGEVTPLFFIGAALGNTLAVLLGLPVDLFAGLGFVAVFAGASNTPLACTLMGMELFGAEHGLAFAVVCFVAYHFSGHSGIYTSQRVAVSKHGDLQGGQLSRLRDFDR